jgi:hypothetical protein
MNDQQESMFDEPADTLPSYEEEAAFTPEETDATEFLEEAESSVGVMQAYEPEPAEAAVAPGHVIEPSEPTAEPAVPHAAVVPDAGQPAQAAAAHETPVTTPLPILTVDDFASLEERVLRAVSLVRREREGRIAAEERAVVLEGRLAGLQLEVAAVERLQDEIESLRAEREQVRQRVERLLVQLDALEF